MDIKKLFFPVGTIAMFSAPISTIININNKMYGSQLDIYVLATKYEEFHQKKGTLNYNQMKTNIGSVTTHQLGIEAPNAKGIDVSLRIINSDPANKLVDVIYMIYKNGFNDATGIITIYAKDHVDNPDFDGVTSIINAFEQVQTTDHGDLYPHLWEIGNQVTVDELGINEPEKNGAQIEYIIKAIDLKTGQVIVNAVVIKGFEKQNVEIIINGFKTSDNQSDEDFNKVVDQIVEEVTTKNQIYPDWEIGNQVTPAQLGIDDITTTGEIQVEYKIKDIDKETGEVIVAIKVTSGDKTVEKDTKVTGFQTKDEKDQTALDKVMEKITDDTSTLNDQFPEWKIGDEVTREDLGINPIEIDQGDVKTTYIVKTLDPKTGTMTLVVTGTIGNKETSKEITIAGFKSTDQVNNEIINQVKEVIDTKYRDIVLQPDSPWKNKLPSETQEIIPLEISNQQLKELNIAELTTEEKQGTTLTYKISEFNDENGQVTIEVFIKKDGISTISSFTIDGFQTTNQHNEKLVNEAYKKVLDDNKITEENKTVHLVTSSNYTSRLPSKVRIDIGMNLNPTQLRNLNIAPLQDPQVEIHSQVTNIDDEAGSITIVITLSKGEHQKNLTMIVKGFRTKNDQDKLDVSNLKSYLQDLYKDVQIKSDSNDQNALPSEIKSQLGTNNLTQDEVERLNIKVLTDKVLKEATVDYAIINTNDGGGQIEIKVAIKQGNIVDSFNFQVKGFQTENKRNQIAVEKALEKFQKDNVDKTIDKTSGLTDKTPTEAGYKVGETLVGERLNKLQLEINDDDFDIDWEFRVKKINDEEGTITIEVIVKKSFAETQDNLTIWGFKNSSSY